MQKILYRSTSCSTFLPAKYLIDPTSLFPKTYYPGNLPQNEVKMVLRRGGLQKPLDNMLISLVQKEAESQ